MKVEMRSDHMRALLKSMVRNLHVDSAGNRDLPKILEKVNHRISQLFR